MGWPAGDLLSGPRGRRLCWALLDAGHCRGWDRIWNGAMTGDLSGLTDEVAGCVAQTDLGSIAATAGDRPLLEALGESVARAMYWQEPDQVDRALTNLAVREALLPIARAVAVAPAAQWWPAPVAADRQQYVEWLGWPDDPPALTGAGATLAAWRSATLEDERSAGGRPADPSAPYTGNWWSAPLPSRLPATTSAIPGIGPLGLVVVEDGLGWREARCHPVALRDGGTARIYEVTGPDRWAELVGRYPLDVSKSRRHDWWKVTGWTGAWVIPDFAAVAADYDAIHVSVLGYLVTAGRAFPVRGTAGGRAPVGRPPGGGALAATEGGAGQVAAAGEAPAGDGPRTVLAGWDPGQTYWLTDILTASGPPVRWAAREDEPLGWAPAADPGG